MAQTGSNETRLIILRGNSASGKTSTAWNIRDRWGSGIAIVSQDVFRRDVLRDKDMPGNANIGLIDLNVRYALDHGFHAIVEGIMSNRSYGAMLAQLASDHVGQTSSFYYDIPFEITLERHTTKATANDYGEELMRGWYMERDLVPALTEKIIGPEFSQEEAIRLIMDASGLSVLTNPHE